MICAPVNPVLLRWARERARVAQGDFPPEALAAPAPAGTGSRTVHGWCHCGSHAFGLCIATGRDGSAECYTCRDARCLLAFSFWGGVRSYWNNQRGRWSCSGLQGLSSSERSKGAGPPP